MPDTLDPATARPLPAADRPDALVLDGPGAPCLQGVQCTDCGAFAFPPTRFCARCSSRAVERRRLGRQATLHTWTTVFQDPGPSFVGEKPYTIVTVDLPEGVRVVSTLSGGTDPAMLHPGLPLALDVVEVGRDAEGAPLCDFRFRPAPGPG